MRSLALCPQEGQMHEIVLGTPQTSFATLSGTLAVTLIVTIAAYVIGTTGLHLSTIRLRPYPAVLRDDHPTAVRPCLIGIPSCLSLFPPPVPCLERCPGDVQLESIDAVPW